MKHLNMVYFILMNSSEFYTHQQRGAVDNKIFTSEDGHSEVVYDKDGILVQDGINDGTFNYFHPSQMPLKHFLYDIHPWIMGGLSSKDPTLKQERIGAYSNDFARGILKSLVLKNELEEHWKETWDNRDQLKVLALFIKAIEIGKAASIFDYFEIGLESLNEGAFKETIKHFESGLMDIYLSD